jgi:hypothetical protein
MTDLFLLSGAQMGRIEGYFPLSHGIARVDDRRIVSAIKGRTPSDRTVCKVMQRSLRIRRSLIHNSPPRDPLRDHRRERSIMS